MLTRTIAPEQHVLLFPVKLQGWLLHFQFLSYAPKFHKTESGSGTKNAAHHDDNLYVHWCGLLSRRALQLLQTYTPTGTTVSQKDTAKGCGLLLAF